MRQLSNINFFIFLFIFNINKMLMFKKKKYVVGRGFLDSLSTVFNSFNASTIPAFRRVGSYLSTNKDLIAKPVLGAIGSLAATALTAGVPAIKNHIKNKKPTFDNASCVEQPEIKLGPEGQAILDRMLANLQPVSNIIGSGVKKSKRKGAGIKTF
jgi:hypothetical protein